MLGCASQWCVWQLLHFQSVLFLLGKPLILRPWPLYLCHSFIPHPVWLLFLLLFLHLLPLLFYKSCFLEDVTDISLDHKFKLLILSNLSDFLCVPMTSNTHMRYVPYLAQFKNYLQITFINSSGD